MKQPAIIGLLTACATVVTACSIPAQDAAPAAPPAATQPAVTKPSASAIPAASSTAPTAGFGDWSMPKPGPIQPKIKMDQLFRACREIPDHVAQKVGIRLLRDKERPGFTHSCPFEVIGGKSTGVYDVFTIDYPLERVLSNGTTELISKLDGGLNGVVTRAAGPLGKFGCDVMVETERGVVGLGFDSIEDSAWGTLNCDLTTSLIKQLFQVSRG